MSKKYKFVFYFPQKYALGNTFAKIDTTAEKSV